MIRRTSSHVFDQAKKMPPLRHSVGAQFDIDKSEAVSWLLAQKDMRTDVLNRLFHSCSRRGLIVYDKATGTWQGKDYKTPPPPFVF